MVPTPSPRLELDLVQLHEFYDREADLGQPRIAWFGQSEIVGITVFEATADLYRLYLADGTTHIIGGRKWIYVMACHSSQQGGAL